MEGEGFNNQGGCINRESGGSSAMVIPLEDISRGNEVLENTIE